MEQVTSGAAGRESVAITEGLGGIFGIKAGMTQVYNEQGESLAVTVIDLKSPTVTQVKTKAKDGYNAVQVGIVEKIAKRVNRPELGHFKKAGLAQGYYTVKEIRLPESAKLEGIEAGKVLSPEFIKAGDCIDLMSVSKGKGFQGGMKRYHMAGGPKSHGASVSHRSLGSIGNRADPAKCFKNKKMAGQMGSVQVTIQNVKVVRVDLENQLILVHGSIPGPKSGVVRIRKAVKRAGK